MKSFYKILCIAVYIILFLISCSTTKVKENEEVDINYSLIGSSLWWDYFLSNHDYHLRFEYSEEDGWTATIIGHYYRETKPSITLRINDTKASIDWGYTFKSQPPPWHYGRISLSSLNLYPGQEITISLKTSEGISKVTMRLPSQKPELLNPSEIYRPDEEYILNWELSQVADFQALRVIVDSEMYPTGERGEFFYYIDPSIKSYNIPANEYIYPTEDGDIFPDNIIISIENVSARSTGAHIFTATLRDTILPQIIVDNS